MTNYVFTSIRWIDGKQKKVIVDICGHIVNRNPTKEELIGIRPEISRRQLDKLSGEYRKQYLLEFLRYFNEKEGRPPTRRDFENNSAYPSRNIYVRIFGSLSNALKLVGLDTDSMVKKGVVETSNQKARLAEIMVLKHFAENPTDLSGENRLSKYDGICPNGKVYDVKSSKLHNGAFYNFSTRNKFRENIEIYYFLGFNKDYTIFEHAWRVPGEIVDSDNVMITIIGKRGNSADIENMKDYDITDIIKEVYNTKKD